VLGPLLVRGSSRLFPLSCVMRVKCLVEARFIAHARKHTFDRHMHLFDTKTVLSSSMRFSPRTMARLCMLFLLCVAKFMPRGVVNSVLDFMPGIVFP
jgi:hypothetical protein